MFSSASVRPRSSRRHFGRWTPAALLVLATSPFLAHAQTRADSSDSAKARRRLDAVVVTESRSVAPSTVTVESRGLPTPVTVLTHEELDRTNLGRDAGTLFRRVPGVMVHNLGQGGTGTSVKMRGFATSTHGADVAVYIDGMPQNVPSSAINHGMNDMTWLTPDMIDRIEVIKGPFSALYGDQNRAGAINIVTRAGAASSSIAGQLGSYATNRGDVVLSGARGRFTSLLVGDLLSENGYRDNSDERRSTIFGKTAATFGNSMLALRGMYHNDRWNAPGFLNLTGLEAGRPLPTDRDTTAPPLWGNAERTNVTLTHTPASGENGPRVTAYFENYERTRALGANRTDLNVQHDDRRIYGARAIENLAWRDRAALVVGGETRADKGDAINRRWPSGVAGPNYTFDQDLDLLTYAAFAQGQVKPIKYVKLIAGVRADRFDYEIANRKLPAASVQYKKSVVTPRGGIVVMPISRVDLFANVGQGFRSPNQTEISPSGSLGPLGASGGASYPHLDVPKVKSYDVGFTARPSTWWTVTGARYHTLNENEITQITPGVFASVGNTTRDGWEVESIAAITDALDVYASYGRILRARINNPVAGTADRLTVPDHTYKGGVGYTLPLGAYRVLLNLDAGQISGLPYFIGSPLALAFTHPYTRYDFRTTVTRRHIELTGFLTSQPIAYSSEVATSSTTGALVDPRPRTEGGALVRYRFFGRS